MHNNSAIFLIDKIESTHRYADLLQKLQSPCSVSKFLQEKNLFEYYSKLIIAILHQVDIVILDPDFSDIEAEKLTGISKIEREKEVVICPPYLVNDATELLTKIKSSNSFITLFTSGTTGQPKKITHSVQKFLSATKSEEKFNDNRWALAYNAAHMAGLQVFFQSLVNLNLMVDVFGDEKSVVIQKLKAHHVTHISATPTFYRLLLPPDFELPEVKNVTLGGEKSDSILLEKLKQAFPNAKFTNIYASTEAGALFHAKGDVFEVKQELLPHIKIEQQQLFLSQHLLGKIDSNQQPWFATGDLVEIVSEHPLQFRFLSRANEMINVGGNKVNPYEVEAAISEFEGVKKVYVYGKPNSVLGHVLMAEIESDLNLSVQELRQFLKTKLQDFKIPRIISQVANIATTRSGKLKRS